MPAARPHVTEALVLVRIRWQRALRFKRWKSQGQIDTWRSTKPERIRCDVYAQWLAMVLQHGMLVIGCWEYADRSLVKAAQVVRDHAPALASARGRIAHLGEVLETIQHGLKRTARMHTRRTKPNTYQ